MTIHPTKAAAAAAIFCTHTGCATLLDWKSCVSMTGPNSRPAAICRSCWEALGPEKQKVCAERCADLAIGWAPSDWSPRRIKKAITAGF